MARFYHYKNNSIPHKTRFAGNSHDTLSKSSLEHSSLLRTFGLSATSTYDSYLPSIFGIFALIWGHFWNVRKGRFWGHGGCRGQTTSKSKTMKILNENLLKLDDFQNLASSDLENDLLTSTTSEVAEWFFSKIT